MYIDKENMFSDAQVITADAVSTNIIDLGNSAYDNGPGNPLVIALGIPEAFNTLTNIIVTVQTDDDVAFGSIRSLYAATFVLADLVLGAQFTLPLPLERVERYLRLNYDVTGSNPTLGKIDAWLTSPDMIQSRSFRDA